MHDSYLSVMFTDLPCYIQVDPAVKQHVQDVSMEGAFLHIGTQEKAWLDQVKCPIQSIRPIPQ